MELIEISYSLGFHNCDLWIFNIAFTLMFITYYYSLKHYKHQIYSLSFIFFNNLIILIVKSFFPLENNVYETTKNIFNYKLFTIAIFCLFIINSFLISFSRVLGKVLMELKYISPYSIIILIGVFGSILTCIFLSITSNFNCKGDKFENICNIYDINYNKNETFIYYDSIPIYFSNLKYNLNNKTSLFYIEILIVTPLYLFMNFMVFNYEILLIYYLNPIYILISDSLYYGTKSLLFYLLNSEENNDFVSFILNQISDLIAFVGYLIYLEIIELRFCGLNKNIRKEISERAILDLISPDGINMEEEEEEEENKEEEEENEEENVNKEEDKKKERAIDVKKEEKENEEENVNKEEDEKKERLIDVKKEEKENKEENENKEEEVKKDRLIDIKKEEKDNEEKNEKKKKRKKMRE